MTIKGNPTPCASKILSLFDMQLALGKKKTEQEVRIWTKMFLKVVLVSSTGCIREG